MSDCINCWELWVMCSNNISEHTSFGSIPTIVFYYFFLSLNRLVLWGWGLRTDRVYITLSQHCTTSIYNNKSFVYTYRLTSAQVFLLFRSEYKKCTCSCTVGKKASTVQYGYRKWGTHARVFSQTLAHGDSKK